MKILYIDIETTGLDWTWCQTLQIGMVIDDLADQKPIADLTRFNYLVTHDRYVGDPYALALNAHLLKAIANADPAYQYVPNKRVVHIMEDWLYRNWLTPQGDWDDKEARKINVAGKNIANFDINFLAALPGFSRNGGGLVIGDFEFRARMIDPALSFTNLITDKHLPNLNTCLTRANIVSETKHDAIDDCLLVLQLVRAITNNKTEIHNLINLERQTLEGIKATQEVICR